MRRHFNCVRVSVIESDGSMMVVVVMVMMTVVVMFGGECEDK
jgi:hypothetical protein